MTMPPASNNNAFRALIGFGLMVLVFLLGVMGAGYAMLDAKKADKDAVAQMQADIREIRNFLMGPRP